MSGRGWGQPPNRGGGNGGRGSAAAAGRNGGGSNGTGRGGDVSRQMSGLSVGGANGSGRGGRGGARGGRQPREANLDDIFKTKPDGLATKQGRFNPNAEKQVELRSNFFPMKIKGFAVIQYSIQYKSEMDLHDQTGRKRFLIGQMKDDLPEQRLFTGDVMFTIQRLAKDELTRTVFLDKDGAKEPVEVTFKLVKEVQATDPGYLQVLNHMDNDNLRSLNLKASGRAHFDIEAKREFPNHCLEIWPGIATTTRCHEHSTLMRLEITHKVVRRDTAYDTIKELRNPDDCKKALLGATIVTAYNNKTYRIDDIDFEQNPSNATFEYLDQGSITLQEYFRKRYNQNIRDPKQPLLVSMPKKRDIRAGRVQPIWLIPELCCLTGLTDRQRSNYHMMKDLAVCLKQGPAEKLRAVEKYGQRLYEANQASRVLTKWGMEVDPKPIRLKGRVLQPQKIYLGTHGRNGAVTERIVDYDSPHKSEWTNAVKDGMLTPTNLSKWVVVFPERMKQEVTAFFNAMRDISPKLGLNMEQAPRYVPLPDTRGATYANKLKEVVGWDPYFVVAVFPNQQADLYKLVKTELLVRSGIPNQVLTRQKCLVPDKRSGGVKLAVATKVAVQIACKLGAIPWKVSVPMKDTMVVGFDTYHNKTRRNMKSVGALVASYDQNWAKYYSDTCRHEEQNEITDFMGQLFLNALRHYASKNGGKMPLKVFFYRDGVGEGQIQHVFETEVKKLKEVIDSIPEGQSRPKLTIAIVSKRIAPRFFLEAPAGGRGGGGISNPPAGTIVDDFVTLPERYDFFLVSQTVTEGTVNPTSFNIILDENNLPPERHQLLAYKLCHLYPNWPGTVRVPAPCQLAHKLAFLLGEHELDNPHPQLRETLFCL